MISTIANFLSYPFIQRAIVVGVLVSVCCAVLGVCLVLKNFSMIGDGLSHVGFGAISVALACNLAPLPFAIPIVVIVAFLLLRLSSSGKMGGETAIALVSSSALAIGVTVTSLSSSNSNIDAYSYMFGSILALDTSDTILSVIIAFAVLVLFVFFYNKIYAITFDETFAKAVGINVELYNMLLALLSSVIIVVGMKLLGALLISSLILFPTLSAKHFSKNFKGVIIWAAAISIVCLLIGLVGSFVFSIPSGAGVVLTHLVFFTIVSLFSAITKKAKANQT